MSVTKDLIWVGSSKKDLLKMPGEVIDVVGYALHLAQTGRRHAQAKVLKGQGSAGLLEVVEDDDGSTYRAVYTVQFQDAVYVLHCFQKKSTQGISTPKRDLDLIQRRLTAARMNSMGA